MERIRRQTSAAGSSAALRPVDAEESRSMKTMIAEDSD
jgi:hypothetical protein